MIIFFSLSFSCILDFWDRELSCSQAVQIWELSWFKMNWKKRKNRLIKYINMISYVESFNVFGAITVEFHPKSENKFKNLLESRLNSVYLGKV